MKKWNRIFGIAAMAVGMSGLAIAQGSIDPDQIREQVRAARDAVKSIDTDQIREQVRAAQIAAGAIDQSQLQEQMRAAEKAMQSLRSEDVQNSLRAAQRAMDHANLSQIQNGMRAAQRAMESVDMNQIGANLRAAQQAMQSDQVQHALQDLQFNRPEIDHAMAMLGSGALADVSSTWAQVAPGFAFQQGDEARQRAQEARERAQELRDRQRESVERSADTEQRKVDIFREGTGSIDDGRYERAVSAFNRLLDMDSKWARADGAYYFKAYALNKLGRRDEALAALGEISKNFPQSRWIPDANALQVEINQAKGNPVSPENIDNQDLKLVALNALMNSDSERAVPLVGGVLNDPKNNVALKAKALYVLAQSRNEKAREIVTNYAKSGSNPDLQIRAVQYIGAFRTPASQQTLADIYAASNDVSLKRAVLRGMGNSRDNAHLLAAVRNEQNPELRREAIRDLGNMQAATELAQLYATESNTELKDAILLALMNARATDKVLDIAKNEKNTELRGDAIRYLANMRGAGARGESSADGLAGLYASETDKNVKEQIIRSLGSQGAGKQLVEIARNEKDIELKKQAITWLGRMRNSKEATDYLAELLSK